MLSLPQLKQEGMIAMKGEKTMYMAGLAAGLRDAHLRMLRRAMEHPEGLLTPLASMTPEEHARFGREIVALGHAEFVSGVSFREEDVWYMEESARLLRITELGVTAMRERGGDEGAEQRETPCPPASVAEAQVPPPGTTVDKPNASGMSGNVTRRVLAMLERPEGALVDELAEAFGWRKHTVRGFLSQLRAKGFRIATVAERGVGHGRPRMRYHLR